MTDNKYITYPKLQNQPSNVAVILNTKKYHSVHTVSIYDIVHSVNTCQRVHTLAAVSLQSSLGKNKFDPLCLHLELLPPSQLISLRHISGRSAKLKAGKLDET